MDSRMGQLSGILGAVFLYRETRGKILCYIKSTVYKGLHKVTV